MFKIGDKVFCVNNRWVENKLKYGEEYTIQQIRGLHVLVEGNNGTIDNIFRKERFSLTPPKEIKFCTLKDLKE